MIEVWGFTVYDIRHGFQMRHPRGIENNPPNKSACMNERCSRTEKSRSQRDRVNGSLDFPTEKNHVCWLLLPCNNTVD